MANIMKRDSSGIGRRLRGGIVRTRNRVVGEGARYEHLGDAMAFSRLTRNEMNERQFEQLKAVLCYAGDKIPYWRDLFLERGFNPSSFAEPGELEKLPVLTKQIIRDQGERMISEEFNVRDLVVRKTGGSTGEPLRFWIDRPSLEKQMAILLRSFRLVDVYEGDRMAKIWGYGASHNFANRFGPVTGEIFLDAFDSSEKNLEKWVRVLTKFKPTALYGYGTAIYHLARYIRHTRKSPIPSLRIVCTTAEKLFPEMRREIQATLGVAVSDMYGCHEVVRLASECTHGGMHVAGDAAFLEFQDDSAIEDAGDDPKKILITTLLARAMPLIRYDVGDFGRALARSCPCGLEMPLMSMDIGKVHHIFTFPEGEMVHTTVFTKELYCLESLDAFQVRQTARDRVDILGVPRAEKRDDAKEDLEAAALRIREQIKTHVHIQARIVEEIPKTARGKQPSVMSFV